MACMAVPCLLGKGLIKSISYCVKGHNEDMVVSFSGGCCCANFNVLASARIYCSVDQW